MADLVVGLAKSVVEGALTKAHAAIEEEAKLRQSAQRDLVFITGEIEMMHSFLNVANEERVGNRVVRTWVRQVRELAYDVEDCIEFVVHLDTKTSWWWRFNLHLNRHMPLMCMALPVPALPLDEAVDEIEQLKARVQDVSKRNARYNLISDSGSKSLVTHHHLPQQPTAAAVIASQMLIEARDATKNKNRRQKGLFGDLTQLITMRDHSELQVISVWGAGSDHGTTSIIRKAYNDPNICSTFACRSWVKLVHPFSPGDFIPSMMAQFYANSSTETIVGMHVLTRMEAKQKQLFKEFQELVTQKRFLVVLEGLSNMVEWDAIASFFPRTDKGSCIIVSAQQSEIASLCIGNSYHILELKRFSDEHSVCALFKVSQGNEDQGSNRTAKERMNNKRLIGREWMKNNPLIGRDSRMNELRKYPAKALVNSPPIMSVWGISSVGKTALVKNLYFHSMLHTATFGDYYWVDLSHPFSLTDFYRSLLPDFHSDKDHLEECHNLLEHDRCLIVIDDLRSKEEWDLIQAALVYKYSKSVIIVITTEASIARHCTNNEDLIFNVKALKSAAAFDLFWTQVQKKNLSHPSIGHEDLKELILKCGGLPKVISVIAGLLATKSDKGMDIIRSLNRRFMHHLETDPDYDSLRDLFDWMHTYFRTCPDSLKPCIFYLSIFPRDYIIRRRRLVRRWIAEGYSRDGHDESAEENGEKHFSELFELSIIQQQPQLVTAAFSDTRMVFCQVNGFIREYIVSQRMGENLVFELGPKCVLTTQRTGRHLIILTSWDRDKIVFESMDFSRLRSLTVFGKWESFFIAESMKMLRVLDLEDASDLEDADLGRMVKCLRRLKFLSLRGRSEICHLPSSLGDLRQLQTLDVRDTSVVTLPVSITKLEKLQYIRAGTTALGVSAAQISSTWLPMFCKRRQRAGVVVPGGIRKLTVLHTLGVVNVDASGGKAIIKEIEKLTQLRKLGVSGITRNNTKEFFSVISKQRNLESLSVQLNQDSQGFLHDISLPWENLQSLKLYGLQDNLPVSIKQLTKLTKLDLEMPTLSESDIEILAKLPKLCILRLGVKQSILKFYTELYTIEEKSFKKVKILEIASISSEFSVTFGSKAMKKLELLKLDCSSRSSYSFSGLNHLSELKEVLLKGTNDETFKTDVEKIFANLPKKPAVKLEELARSS